LKERGLIDAGLVLVQDGMLQGYIGEGELDFGLSHLGEMFDANCHVLMLGQADEGDFGLSTFVDRSPTDYLCKSSDGICRGDVWQIGLTASVRAGRGVSQAHWGGCPISRSS